MPTWLSIFLSLGGSTLISMIMTTIFNKIVKDSKKKIEANEQLKTETFTENIRTIIQEEITPLKQDIKELRKQEQINKEGILANLRTEILQEWTKCKTRGYCTTEEKANVTTMIQAYEKLGGNSFVLHTIKPDFEEEIEVLTNEEDFERKYRQKVEQEKQLQDFQELVDEKPALEALLTVMQDCPHSCPHYEAFTEAVYFHSPKAARRQQRSK